HSFQRSRLSQIYVEQDADGDGTFETVIRRYVFAYGDGSSNNIFPGFTYTAGGKMTTLQSVTQYGLGGTTALPSTTFTYGDGLHLTHASNGYGGSVDFEYELWRFEHPQDDEDQPYRGNTHYYDYTEAGLCNTIRDGWAARGAGSSLSCPSNMPGMVMTGEIINTKAGEAGGATPVVSARPGGFYRMWMRAIYSDDTTVKFGLDDGLADTWSADIPVTPSGTYPYDSFADAILELPLEASEAYPLIQISGPINTGRILEFKFELLFSIYRVVRKTLKDGQGNSYTFNYAYQDPAVNDENNSERICTAITGYCKEYIPKYSEFRGHRVVTETGPDGRVTTTTYHQDDVLRGRPEAVDVSGLQQTVYTYESTALPFTPPTFTGGYAYKGLGRDWARTTREETTYLGGTTTKTFTYESTYGNLTDQAEYEGLAGGDPYRTTHTDYFPNISGGLYLVGLPARQQVKNGSGTVLAETLNLYDGANSYNTAPTVGKLTAVRTLISGTQYSQVSTGYDAWGNPVTVTTYSGYGTAASAPTTGARTTTTVYDSTYHTYAVSSTNPLNQTTTIGYNYSLGLPVSETDPNGAVITAEYDAFGRMTKLVRPGDTSGAPTLSISYSDSSSGLVATLTQRINSTQSFVLIRKYDGMGRNYQSSAGGILTDLAYNAYGQVISQSTPHASGETAYYTTTTHDALGRPLTVTAPDNTSTTYSYDGLTTTVTDANGHSTTTDMDVWGRTTVVTPPSGPAVMFTYDPLGNLLTAERGGATMTLTYDNAGRKLTMDDPDMGDWSYTYDALGDLLTQTDARGCVLTMTYDSLNRLTEKSSSGAGCGTQVSATYTYDVGANGIGRRTSMGVSGGDYTSWTYDARGRLLTESKQIPGGGQYVTSYAYNSADLPTSLTYPDGETVNYTYTDRMLLNSLAGTSTYVSSTTYDSAGRIDLRILGNSRRTDYVYYPWTQQGGRLQYIQSGTSGTPTSLQNLTYTYDPVGNVLTITDSIAGPQTQTFAYDALDRLTSASASGGTSGLYSETYTYNAATGNLASKGGVNYTYASGHAHAVSSLSNGNTYTYDQNGNMTSRHVGSQTFTLAYDAENRLVSVSGAVTASFLYDADGKQVKAVVGSTTTYYIGAHYQVDNGVVTKYYSAGATRIAMRKNGTLYYLLTD
ncbi:MAG: RHS repeat protein, partial [Chloroflexi bacterium]|nr:RHS repeat protein [Chloroflexota bacterium]